jgi:hypothetical protein
MDYDNLSYSELLMKYNTINDDIDNIRQNITNIQEATKIKLESAKNENARTSIMAHFKEQIHEINEDKTTKIKFKNLQKEKIIIESKLSQLKDKNSDTCKMNSDTAIVNAQSYDSSGNIQLNVQPTIQSDVEVDANSYKTTRAQTTASTDVLDQLINKYEKLAMSQNINVCDVTYVSPKKINKKVGQIISSLVINSDSDSDIDNDIDH